MSAHILGTWYYNDGRSLYTVAELGKDLYYGQKLSNGQDIFGKLLAASAKDWEWEAELNNKARIRIKGGGHDSLVTSYQRAGDREWRPTTSARRGPDPGDAETRQGEDGNAYAKAAFMQFYGGTAEWDKAIVVSTGPAAGQEKGKGKGKQKGKGKGDGAVVAIPAKQKPRPENLNPDRLMSHIRQTMLSTAVASQTAGSMPLASAVLKAVASANQTPGSLFDRLPPIPLAELIDEERLDEFHAEQKKPDPRKTIVPVPAVRMFENLLHPVSYNEEQMVRLFASDPFSPAYNLSTMQRGLVNLDARGATETILSMTSRHDVLRSGYRFDASNNCVRKVEREHVGGGYTLAVGTDLDAQKIALLDRMLSHRMGFSSARFYTILSSDGCCSLGFNLHHVLADADAMGDCANEMFLSSTLFAGGLSKETVYERLPKLPVQFVDFSYWQKSLAAQGYLENELAYWCSGVLSACPPMVLDLPLDTPRPRAWVAQGAGTRVLMDQEVLLPMRQASSKATPFGAIFATFGITLSRLSGQSCIYVACPFALRSLPSLHQLIGNYLNMMPVKIAYDPTETFAAVLDRVAIANMNVQRYSLAPFLTMVDKTKKHYPIQDPSRNPMYQSMIDQVPNSSETPSDGLAGVLDWFIFVNTNQSGNIWSVDGVYNTLVYGEQTVKMFLLHLSAVTTAAAKFGKAPVPRAVASKEELQEVWDGGIPLTHVMTKTGSLPQIISVKSGWEAEGATAEYYGVRNARCFKTHSGLEISADFPPLKLADLRMPGAAAPKPGVKEVKPAVQEVKQEAPLALPVMTAEEKQADAEAKRADLARRRARSYEVASLWAEAQRQSDVIPLDGPNESDLDLLRAARNRKRGATGRGRAR